MARSRVIPTRSCQWSSAPTLLERRVSECVERIYSSAVSSRGPSQACTDIARLFGACRVDLLCNVNSSPAPVSSESPLLVLDHSTKADFLREALLTCGCDHGICALVREGTCGLDVMVVLRHGVPFSADECEWLKLLTRHIGIALDLEQRLISPVPTLTWAAQFARSLPQPCVLTDATGLCLGTNDAFRKVLERIEGSVGSGRLVFYDLFLQHAWERALRQVHATGSAQSFLANVKGGSIWRVHVVPVASVPNCVDRTIRPAMLATFEAASHSRQPPSAGSAPLTKAEHEVLSMLLRGHSAKEIAHARSAAVNTVRTQITSILSKTGHHSQKQLIASSSTNGPSGN